MNEFKIIPNYERYEINIDGIIRNVETKYIKSQYIGSTGYYMVSFSYKHKSKPHRVHKLLAETFLNNLNNYTEINHKNGIKTDNNINNLEWCTHLENVRHAFNIGLVNNTGENNGMSKLKKKEVIEIKELLKSGMSQNKIALKYNISRSTILLINLGKRWKNV